MEAKFTKTVLISHFPIPYKGIASWTTLLKNLLLNKKGLIDYIICPYKDFDKTVDIQNTNHILIEEPRYFRYKIERIIKHYRFYTYWNAVKKLLDKYDSLVLMIVDNPGILKAIDYYAKKHKLKKRIRIIFFMHAYHYFLSPEDLERFYLSMDNLILLSKSSYRFQITQGHSLPTEVDIIYNGIDSKKFKPPTPAEKKELRTKYGINNNRLIFLWLSQDRPKKGIQIILNAWNKIAERHNNAELFIVGTHNEITGKNIRSFGKISNDLLPDYYRVSDFYLFSTLCHEGHPMSLTEAIKSGCTCLASNIEPIDEIMGNGRYGRLVDFPNNVQCWIETIEEEINKYITNDRCNPYLDKIPEKLYDLDDWCDNVERLVEKWKKRLL